MENNMENFSEIRLRFAPSPTGYLHVGGARTALFNYLFAKANNGKFILRIEDTDQERSTETATQQVLESMKWLGMDWDEGPAFPYTPERKSVGEYGPYYQAERLHVYQEKLEQLFNEKKIYPCFCSDEELNLKRKQAEAMGVAYTYDRKCLGLGEEETRERMQSESKWVYRFQVTQDEILFEDEIKDKIKFDTKLIGDFVVRKSDGFPTYNFAVVVDDSMMKISHVLRGDDHISNTPRQILLYQALNQPVPKFYHISMILSKDGDKLSKRHGAVSVLDFKDEGYYRDPLLNHLALLGWSPEDGVEVISKDNLEKAFINPKFSSSPAIFDQDKLDYLNGLYLRNLPDEEILSNLKEELAHQKVATDIPKLNQVLLLLKGYCRRVSDIKEHLQKFNTPIEELIAKLSEDEKEWIENDNAGQLFNLAMEVFSAKEEEFIERDEFNTLIAKAKELGIKGKNLFFPLRIKLTGEPHGLELDQFLTLKYRSEIIERLKK